MTQQFMCQSCGKELSVGGLKYVVEIKSFADYDGYIEELSGAGEDCLGELLEAVEGMDAKVLEEEVYQELSYVVCKGCRDRLIKDPFHTGRVGLERGSSKETFH